MITQLSPISTKSRIIAPGSILQLNFERSARGMAEFLLSISILNLEIKLELSFLIFQTHLIRKIKFQNFHHRKNPIF